MTTMIDSVASLDAIQAKKKNVSKPMRQRHNYSLALEQKIQWLDDVMCGGSMR
jgi:hypothetical protein